MNCRLADFLVELSDPEKARAFVQDPEGAMEAAKLSDGDRLALRMRDYGVIRYQVTKGDLNPITSDQIHTTDRTDFDFVHVEINHQTETNHDLIALRQEGIKRRFGPHTSFYPDNSN